MSIAKNCELREHRRTCLSCGAELPGEPLLTLSDMPESAQDIPGKEELSLDHGIELRLCRCRDCGLVQFDCEPVDYYPAVIRAVGLSETMRELRRRDYRHMIDAYGLFGGKFLECGCGRGEFLQVLKEFPVQICGMEADPEAAKAAQALLGPDCRILPCFAGEEAMDLPGAPFDCFLSFNFLEHQPDPGVMLRAMYRNLKPGGYGLITVPSFEYILEQGRYYELIRDHIANYTAESLRRLLRDCGFEVLEEGRIGIGDTLRAVVKKPEGASAEAAVHRACMDIFSAFQRENSRSAGKDVLPGESADQAEAAASRPAGMAGPAAAETCGIEALRENYMRLREQMAEFMEELKRKGKRLALFGASHQGFTIAATTALSKAALYMMDSAPFKQGRFAPASHIPIVAPSYFAEHPAEVVMITAPGYVKEITAQLRAMYGDGFQICTIEPKSWKGI